jgi:glycine/D-amino acid oxidase-like deaminating enzyme
VRGDDILLAAGAWTTALAPWLASSLRAVAQPVLHFLAQDVESRFPAGRCVWGADISEHGWYGFPGLADGRVKVGHHGRGLALDPAASRELPAGVEDRFRAFLARALPRLAQVSCARARLCFYSDTADGDFWITRDPEHPGLVVAAGGSGHAFKFLPVVGEITADVVEGRETAQTARFAQREPTAGRREAARSLED